MENCSNLFLLITLACQLSECLSEKEMAVLSADLMTLGDMLTSLLAHKSLCETDG